MKRSKEHNRGVWGYASIWLGVGAVCAAFGFLVDEDETMPPMYYFSAGGLIALVGVLTVFFPLLRIFLKRQHYYAQNTRIEKDISPEELLEAQFDDVVAEIRSLLVNADMKFTKIVLRNEPVFFHRKFGRLHAFIPGITYMVVNDQEVGGWGYALAIQSGWQWHGQKMFFLGDRDDALADFEEAWECGMNVGIAEVSENSMAERAK